MTKKRSFFACDSCGFVWADPKSFLDREAEQNRYMLHNNNRYNKEYVQFISTILNRVLQRWNIIVNDAAPRILDWGSGPEPVASELLREQGFQVESYDPFFGPSLPQEQQRFDIIICIEVAEHFKNPLADFAAMNHYLKPGGLLAVHTHTLPDQYFSIKNDEISRFFSSWWYKEDPTHVAFYSEITLRTLGFVCGLHYEHGDGSDEGTLHYFIKPLPVLVAGGANVDIEGRPFGPLNDRDSNPGRVRFSRGGAGRNIAENLARLNIPVQFISVFGKDPLSRMLLEETKAAGVGLDGCLLVEADSPSCYLSILDETGDMKLALSSMDSIKRLTPDVLEACLSALSDQTCAGDSAFDARSPSATGATSAGLVYSMVIIDGNLIPETIEALLDRCPGIPVWFDPVSITKARSIASYKGGALIGRFFGIKPNRDELFAIAESLNWGESKIIPKSIHQFIESISPQEHSSIPRRDLERILMASRFLLDKGCQELHVSLGTEGVIVMNSVSIMWGRPPVLPMISATGAGDSYLAAIVRTRCLESLVGAHDLVVRSGCAASAITLQDQNAVSPQMCPLALYRLLQAWKKNKAFNLLVHD
ncbi:PfkB family carbohydrate kinase [Gracilinema caldarium]|nr:PfkB family carbohydrate kinase [Gracilinema caldarium]